MRLVVPTPRLPRSPPSSALVANVPAPAAKPEISRDAGTAAGVERGAHAAPDPRSLRAPRRHVHRPGRRPYAFAVVRTSPTCQPRARFVDAAKARPSEKAGWKFNDLIRVPSAACGTQLAVVTVWRKPADVAPPTLDAQGQSRIYLRGCAQAGRRPGSSRRCRCSPRRWRSKARPAAVDSRLLIRFDSWKSTPHVRERRLPAIALGNCRWPLRPSACAQRAGGARSGCQGGSFFFTATFFSATYFGRPSRPYGGGASPRISGSR